MSGFRELLSAKIAPFLSLSREQLDLLERHYRLLEQWNRSLNLTAIRSMEEAVERHYAESLFLGYCLERLADWTGSGTIIDAGSGAGFPGFPIAVLCSTSTVTLVESHKRKAVFLAEAAHLIKNVHVEARRLAEVTGSFDVLVSRAVRWDDISDDAERLARAYGLLTTTSAVLPARVHQFELLWAPDRAVILGRLQPHSN